MSQVSAAPVAGALRFEMMSEGRVLPRAERPKEDRDKRGKRYGGGGRGRR